MPTIIYLLADGSRRDVAAEAGDTVMSAAIRNNVPGIEAECGGCLSCATCHVYIQDGPVEQLAQRSEDEDDMLEGVAAERRPESRLGCQIELSAALDGLVVQVPETQV
ncbi:MAG: 2Fe-2S iron-sulfur cluster-binding protein [Aquisalimonadaceae bacterium]